MIPLSLLWDESYLELIQMTEEQNTIFLSARICLQSPLCVQRGLAFLQRRAGFGRNGTKLCKGTEESVSLNQARGGFGAGVLEMIRERQIENWPQWFERATALDVP